MCRVRTLLYPLVWHILLMYSSLASAQEASDAWLSRGSLRHFGGAGVGHTNSFTSADWFLPLSSESDDTMWFGDFRALLFNDGEFGSNAGSGFRWYSGDWDRVFGVNAYWDTRTEDLLLFNQAGLGIESLGTVFDFRANGYLPAVNDTFQARNVFFAGNGLIIPETAALSGGDAEAGIHLPNVQAVSSRIFCGGYYFDSSHVAQAAAGWRVRIEAAWREDVVVGVSAQEDDLFGQTLNGIIELRNIFQHDSSPASRSMRHKFRGRGGAGDGITVRHRLADPVWRQQNIVLKQDFRRLTAPGGAALDIIHVVPGGAGVGTFENPYGSISTAMLDPRAGTGVIYTRLGGSYTENVAMVPGSTLVSNGPVQYVSTDSGSFALPFSGLSSSLTALPSSINGNVTLADNTTLSGFNVQGGVSGTAVTSVSLTTNRISAAPGDALSLSGSDTVSVNSLLISNPAQRGIVLDDTSALLTLVTIENPASTAVRIETTATDRSVSFSTLSVTGAVAGVDANVTGAGDLTMSLSGATISSQQDAVNISNAAGSTGDAVVRMNTISASSTVGPGVVVDGSAGTGTTYVRSLSNITITKAATGGAVFDTVTFDANPGAVSAGTFVVGSTTSRVQGAGVSIENSTGALNVGGLQIFNTNGPGLFADNSSGLTLSSANTSRIDTTFGPALDLNDVVTGLAFNSVRSEQSPGTQHGIHLDNVTGLLTSTTTAVIDSADHAAILIENIPGGPPKHLTVNFGALTIESVFDNVENTNVLLPGDISGITTPIYNPPLTLTGP